MATVSQGKYRLVASLPSGDHYAYFCEGEFSQMLTIYQTMCGDQEVPRVWLEYITDKGLWLKWADSTIARANVAARLHQERMGPSILRG